MDPKKIFLNKKIPEETRTSGVAVGDANFSWQSCKSASEVAALVSSEDPGLLFFDFRGVAGDPMAFIESIRDAQKKTPVFLVSDTLGMVSVIQAIRLGVKDYFQPPIDHHAVIERLQASLKSAGGNPKGIQLEQWTEFMTFLTAGAVLGEAPSSALPEEAKKQAVTTGSAAPVKVEWNTRIPEQKAVISEAQKPKLASVPERALVESGPSPTGRQPSENAGEIKRLQGELDGLQEKFETERLLLKQAQKKIEALQSTMPAAIPSGSELVQQEEAQREAALDAQKLAEGQKKLVAELEKLETEQSLFAQSKARLEKTRADIEARFTERENALVDRTLALDAREKTQSTAEDQFLIEQEKLDSAQALVTQGRQAFEQEKLQWNKTQAAAQQEKAKTEVDFARREQAVARNEAEAKKISEGQKSLAADLQKLAHEQEQLVQAQAKFEKARTEIEAQHAKRENELTQQALALTAQRKAHGEAEKQLLAEREKLEPARVEIAQTQARVAQENKALGEAKVQWEKTMAAAQMDQTKAEASLQKRIKDLAAREEQIAAKEKNIAPLQTQLAAEQEKLETEQLMVKQTLAKIAAERTEIVADREKLQLLKRELADQEAALQETEVKTQTQLVQVKKAQVQLTAAQTTLAAERAAFDKEAGLLAERARQFESKQQQLKEQMKQMLAGA